MRGCPSHLVMLTPTDGGFVVYLVTLGVFVVKALNCSPSQGALKYNTGHVPRIPNDIKFKKKKNYNYIKKKKQLKNDNF